MGVLMHSFFSLPIYKRDHEKYNEDYEEDLKKKKYILVLYAEPLLMS